MKRIISLSIALLLIVSLFALPAHADEEYETPVDPFSYITKADDISAGKTLLRICYDNEFTAFTDEPVIEIVLEKDGETKKTRFDKDSITFFGEETAYREYFRPDEEEPEEHLVAYIITDFIDEEIYDINEGIYAVTAENSLVDSEGNANAEFKSTYTTFFSFSEFWVSGLTDNRGSFCEYKGNTVKFMTEFPCDYYMNGSLKEENSLSYTHTYNSTDLITLTIKKFELSLIVYEIQPQEVTAADKLNLIWSNIDRGLVTIDDLLVLTALVPWLGIPLMIIFPFYMIIPGIENLIATIEILFR